MKKKRKYTFYTHPYTHPQIFAYQIIIKKNYRDVKKKMYKNFKNNPPFSKDFSNVYIERFAKSDLLP